SERQGTHHVAQKLSSTTRPRSSLIRNALPSSFVNCTSGAVGKFCLADDSAGGVVPRKCSSDSKFGNHPAARELASSVTRLLITSRPIRISKIPDPTSTQCK